MKRLILPLVSMIALLSTAAQAEPDKKVVRMFKAKCSACHGVDGHAQTEKGKQMKIIDMTSAEFKAKKNEDLKKSVLEGVKREVNGVKKEMDSWKNEITPEQVDELLAYVKEFK